MTFPKWSSAGVAWTLSGLLGATVAASIAGEGIAQVGSDKPILAYSSQGWTSADRDTFYDTSQGSHLIPYAWFEALKRVDTGAPFAADHLERYGYLRDERASNTGNLPVGFVVDPHLDKQGRVQLGMTCAACHTGQIEYEVNGQARALRIDGAPASADFQAFLTSLQASARWTLATDTAGLARFDDFGKTVIGQSYVRNTKAARQLRQDLTDWTNQFADFMDQSLPADHPWGPGRLDAFGMIFNRVAGRDLGAAPNLDIKANFAKANAPVSYPFLWNATRQDWTQWNGGVPNGARIAGLGRNSGEALGVFAEFRPTKTLLPIDPKKYADNSIDFDGLYRLEDKVATLQPPPWPRALFGLDQQLADAGAKVYRAQCYSCHSDDPPPTGLWKTPRVDVGTDPLTASNAAKRMSDPGPYEGWLMLGASNPLERFNGPVATSAVLRDTVLGVLIANATTLPPPPGGSAVNRAILADANNGAPPASTIDFLKEQLQSMYDPPDRPPGAVYEARVLRGVWATAPYLHNGSVANLRELLTRPEKRHSNFTPGSRRFDPVDVGLPLDAQSGLPGQFKADPTVGNGNGGHTWGTDLSDADKTALIEYLKSL